MALLQLNKANLACLVIVAMLLCASHSLAQVPMYQIFGVNPYSVPNRAPLPHFSPLQSTYSTPGMSIGSHPYCVPCVVGQPITQPYSIGVQPSVIGFIPETTFGTLSVPEQSNGLSDFGSTPTFTEAANQLAAPESSTSQTQGTIESFDRKIISNLAAPKVEPAVTVETPNSAPTPELVAPGSLASPSDIVTPDETQPTLADQATSEIVEQLDEARKQITTLKDELTETRNKARASAERAYAAEKSASAAKESSEKSLVELKAQAAQGTTTSGETKVRLKQSRDQMAQMEKRLVVARKELDIEKGRFAEKEIILQQQLNQMKLEQKKLQMLLEANQMELRKSQIDLATLKKSTDKSQSDRKDKLPKRKNDAQLRLEQLMTDAEAKKSSIDKTSNPADNKKKNAKKTRMAAQEQIENLRESMERQIKRSSDQIRNRSQSKIEQLLNSGKAKDSKEVKKITDEMNSQMEANEEKIRSRIDERIKRIQKESAARGKS